MANIAQIAVKSYVKPGLDVSAAVCGEETPVESALIVAQGLWGLGNLSPLDSIFGSAAVTNLVPKKSLGFIGYHLGRRFHRYAEDTGIWIDAFEVDASLSRQHKKKSSKMQLNAWQPKASLLKEGRYTSLVALQAVDVAGSVADVYSQCAHGLRSGGRLFAADLMLSEQADDEALECIESATAGKAPLVSAEEHGRALKGAGLHLENTFDLTGSLIASIKSGIRDSVSAIEALREFPQPVKKGVSPI